ncbi:MAG: hypothetical protein NT149_01465 [Candidatus Gottesmanbacteria bacterium]|nr:hypothetical protein [Candidatus Gottesmanbacteria bacterium]
MAETLDNSMGDFIARFIQRLSRDPTLSGMAPDEIKQEALRRIKEAEARRTAAKNKEVSDQRAKKSKEWADKVKSKDAKTHQEALTEAEKAKYPAVTLPDAKEHLTYIKKVFDRDPPAWIKTDIQECAQAAEFIARVTQLPPELQNDPNVLYLELAKFNKSMNWSEVPLESRKEARIVQDKVLEQIRIVAGPAFGDASRDALLWEVDSGRTHLKPLITDDSSGEQIQQLQTTTDTNQEILDLQENRSPENQREQLENFIKDLRSGIGGKDTQYDRTEVLKYIASAQARLNLLDSKIIEQRQYGQRIQWDENLEKLYKHHDHKIGEALELGRYLGFNDVKEIAYEGIPGQRKWLARFREKWVGATGESFKPGLEADMQFQEFMRITSWLNGKEHAALTLQYRDLWSLYEDIDSIIKSTLYRPKGQKAEDSFNINRYLSNVHHDMLRKYDLVDIAKPAVSESIEDVMRDEMFLYQKQLDFLKGEIGVDEHGKPIRRIDRFKALKDRYLQKKDFEEMIKLRDEKSRWHQEYHDKDGATVLDRHGRPINNGERLRRLEKQFTGKSETYGGLSQPEYNEMLELETMVDEIGRGVLLRDYHMLVHVEPYSRLLEGHKEYKEIMWDLDPKNHNEPPSQTDRDKKIKRRDELVGEMQQQWKEFTRNNNAEFNPDTDGELLMELRNFSPVEIRAYNRVVQTLRSDWIRDHGGTTEGFEANLKDNSYKIRDAVWAARTIVVGTGEAMEKGGKLGRSARFDLEFTLGLPKEIKTKHFMDRGFAEAYQRVINPYIFEEDFHIGSKMGETSRNLNYEAAFNEVGYDYKKDPSMPQAWKKLVKLARSGPIFWLRACNNFPPIGVCSASPLSRLLKNI